VRYDDYSTFGGTTNPRAAIIFNPSEQTKVKLLKLAKIIQGDP
jgi:outer membrane receptor for ferrienterochelin and colicin